MIRKRNRITAAAYVANDLLATVVAFAAAWILRFQWQVIPGAAGHVPELGRYLQLVPIACLLFPMVFYFHGLYQPRRNRGRVDEFLTTFAAVLLAAVLLSVVVAWYRPAGAIRPDGTTEYFTYSRAFLALFAGLELLTVTIGRVVIQTTLRRARAAGHNLQRILVIGAGDLGKEITRKILAHGALGLEVVGFLDDDTNKTGRSFFGVPVLGTLRNVGQVIEELRVDQVFVALPIDAHRKMLKVLQEVARECVEVKLVPDILQYATLKATLEDLDGTPVINLSQTPLEGGAASSSASWTPPCRQAPWSRCRRHCRSSPWRSGWRTGDRSSIARSAWGSMASRS